MTQVVNKAELTRLNTEVDLDLYFFLNIETFN